MGEEKGDLEEDGFLTRSSWWLGGLFYPASFLASVKQDVARSKGWAMDEMEIRLTSFEEGKEETGSLLVKDVLLDGGDWDAEASSVCLSDLFTSHVPQLAFTWRLRDGEEGGDSRLAVPIYHHENPTELLDQAVIDLPEGTAESAWILRSLSLKL